jgi:hypothetical protein
LRFESYGFASKNPHSQPNQKTLCVIYFNRVPK